ncbi:leucine-rich repeat flightless-interacting protein 2 isoform X4 [Myxocyprinus asiaticus]|uniref:leucine-rich repeat flightless-interacting protein 2 isoform X4 n=1 Tax=Myxocyprinus asiaticus TaxID=70543 RepID=UPI002222B90F|nr:leucine-rich repeat flightless-interacting protein 2 isoform X4 [Myxocyprinus asiaticus]
MASQVTGRKRIPNREKLSAEDDALSQIAREAEARLAAKRAARAEAREIRMKELERQQKEEDSERYSRHSRRHTSISDDDERMSVGSRGSLRGNHSDLCSSTSSLPSARFHNGRPSALFSETPLSRSHRGSLHEESSYSASRRLSGSSTRVPSDYNGFLGSGSRASSRASSARASPVVEERSDFLEKGSRTASTLSAATLASLGGGSSRRGSCDTSISADTEASIREMKDSLVEVEEKYRKAMVSNAHLDNEKTNLMYQVDTLRETLMELEELLCETRREFEEKTRECERECHAHSVLKFQFEEMKETLKQSEELLSEAQQSHGKQEDYIKEISDLQETLEWKDKKIRVLERQKEYSDIIHDERDALRDEVSQLRDALKKHGIVLVSEVTANGKVADGVIDGHADVETASRLNQNAHTPTMSGDSMLDRGPEQQINPTTGTEITRNYGETTQVLEAMSKETLEMQDFAVCTPQKEEIAREGTTGSEAVKRKCSPADMVSSVVGSCLKEHTRPQDDSDSDGPLTLPCGIKALVLQKTGFHVSEDEVELQSPECKVSSATGQAGNMMENSQTHKLDSIRAQSEESAVQTTSWPSEDEVWTVSTEVVKETIINEGIPTLNSTRGRTAPDELEMAGQSKMLMRVEEDSDSECSENYTSKCTDCRFNSSQAKCPPVNVQVLVNKESMSEDEGNVVSSPETSQNMLMQPLKPNSQITSEMAEYELESRQSIGIIAAMKTSQDLKFEPTVDIFNITEGNGAQYQAQQETVVEFELPVEYKGLAFLLDSCQEAVAWDAAFLELDEVSTHSSDPSEELTVAVRRLRVENETRPFFKTKLEIRSIFSCFVS